MKKINYLFFVLGVALITACGGSETTKEVDDSKKMEAENPSTADSLFNAANANMASDTTKK